MTLQLTGKNDVRLAALEYVVAVLEMLQVNVVMRRKEFNCEVKEIERESNLSFRSHPIRSIIMRKIKEIRRELITAAEKVAIGSKVDSKLCCWIKFTKSSIIFNKILYLFFLKFIS